MLFGALAVCALFALVSGERTVGQCPEITTKSPFDVVAYLGRWHEIQRYQVKYEAGNECGTADYEYLTDYAILVTNSGVVNGHPVTIHGAAYTTDVDGSFTLRLQTYPVGSYNVLDTDYDHFSCVYDCTQDGEMKEENAWVLSRSQELDEKTLAEAEAVFTRIGVDVSKFRKTQQGEGCTYIPVP